jgi:hypothetical protein
MSNTLELSTRGVPWAVTQLNPSLRLVAVLDQPAVCLGCQGQYLKARLECVYWTPSAFVHVLGANYWGDIMVRGQALKLPDTWDEPLGNLDIWQHDG